MKKGIGYREFLACRDEIQEYLNKGYNISSIHSILFEQGKITFGRKWFYAVLTKFGMQKIKLNQLRLVGEDTVQQKSGNNDNQSIHQVQKRKQQYKMIKRHHKINRRLRLFVWAMMPLNDMEAA